MIASPPHRPPPPPVPAIYRPYTPFGAAQQVLAARDPEIILSGPAGTGKSRACLEKLFLIATKYAGCRILIVRKTRASLSESALVTWEQKVVPEGHPCIKRDIQRDQRRFYKFPNGSEIIIGGLDKPTKIMSTEYDIIYAQEAIELTEGDWEALTTRLRNGVVPYSQIIADTNPDAPSHWIMQRCNRGVLRMLESRHEDNPVIWDVHHNLPTPAGAVYLSKLDNLTGVRKDRYRWGKWVAAEGLVYEGYDPAIHLIDRTALPKGWGLWPRYWAIDWGYTAPFVWQEWVKSPDGELFRVREIYRTQRLVEEHAADILHITGRRMIFDSQHRPTGRLEVIRDNPDPLPVAIVCDHDKEDRATFERHTGLKTVGAWKPEGSVTSGIQAVASRLKRVPEGHPSAKPRVLLVKGALVERDTELETKRLPCCTEEEILEYVWDTTGGQKRGEKPVKENDHGMDTERYLVAYVDQIHLTGPRRRFRPLQI